MVANRAKTRCADSMCSSSKKNPSTGSKTSDAKKEEEPEGQED
jgi:hypothetical protein